MRLVNRLLALVVAVALFAAGIIFAVEVAAAALGEPAQIFGWHGLYRAGERDTWESSGARALLVVIAAVGLLLLLSQLRPHRPDRLPLDRDATALDAALSRRAVREVLTEAALGVDGVRRAHTTLRRHRAQVTVTTRFGDDTGAQSLRPEIEQTVQDRLDALHLRRSPSVRVAVSAGGKQ